MAQDVPRLVGDQRRGIKDMALGSVLLLDRLELFLRVLAEEVLEQLVQAGTVLNRTISGSALIKHRHGRAVSLGFLDGVAVDELSKNLMGALFVAHDDRRTGEANACAVG
ncbi:hypothetical protein D3C84_944000 [compost metagenome]